MVHREREAGAGLGLLHSATHPRREVDPNSVEKGLLLRHATVGPFPSIWLSLPRLEEKSLVFYRQLSIIIAPKATGSRITLHEV